MIYLIRFGMEHADRCREVFQPGIGTRHGVNLGRVMEMPNMIDLHLHLLPDMDDGASSMAVAEEMLRGAQRWGFHTLVTTPHLVEPLTEAYRSHVAGVLTEVQALAESMQMAVLLGYEAVLSQDLPARLAAEEPITLAGSKALLVELPFTSWPHHAETTLFALQTAGYRPILAHPERYLTLQDDPDRGLELANRGVILQVTIGSLAGLFGKRVQHTAEMWLRAGAVDLVASDAHSAGHRLAAVPRGLARLRHIAGAAEERRLTVDVPAALLSDDVLPASGVASGNRGTRWPRALTRFFSR